MLICYYAVGNVFSHLRHCLQFRLMGQTIEEILGVGTRSSPRINEDLGLIKFTLNKLYCVEIISRQKLGL